MFFLKRFYCHLLGRSLLWSSKWEFEDCSYSTQQQRWFSLAKTSPSWYQTPLNSPSKFWPLRLYSLTAGLTDFTKGHFQSITYEICGMRFGPRTAATPGGDEEKGGGKNASFHLQSGYDLALSPHLEGTCHFLPSPCAMGPCSHLAQRVGQR